MKNDDDTLRVLVLMNALGLALGQHGALQSTGFIAFSRWMAVICTGMAIVIGGWYVYRMRRNAYEPNVEDEPRESEEDRRRRYLNSTVSESSDVEFWMSLRHHSDNSSSEESEQIEANEVSRRVLSALDYGAETLRYTAIAAWLLVRVNRRLAHSTDVVYSDRSRSLGAALRSMTRGEIGPSPAAMRNILREFSKMSPRAESPTNEKTVQQIHDEIQNNYFNDEVNATTPLLGRSDGCGWGRNPDDMDAANTTSGDAGSSSGTEEHVLQTVMEIP